jgi:hypothetical protein
VPVVVTTVPFIMPSADACANSTARLVLLLNAAAAGRDPNAKHNVNPNAKAQANSAAGVGSTVRVGIVQDADNREHAAPSDARARENLFSLNECDPIIGDHVHGALPSLAANLP